MNEQPNLFEQQRQPADLHTHLKRRQTAAGFREQVQAALDAYRPAEGRHPQGRVKSLDDLFPRPGERVILYEIE
jgi:hypothetical protein